MVLLSRSEQDYIRLGCQDDCRMDGRRCLETRDYVIITEKGYFTSSNSPPRPPSRDEQSSTPLEGGNRSDGDPPFILSNGSARLTTLDMQETILCSVKAQVVRPSRNKPDQGIIELFVDRLNSGNQSELDEIQALLSHLLLQDDSVLVDRRSLCILPGEFAWRLSIDLVFMTAVSSATSRLHAVSCVIRAALETTLLPSITTEQNSNPTSSNQEQYTLLVQDDIRKAHPVLTPSSARTVLVTVSLIPCSKLQEQSVVMIVDATTQEQACASGQVHVVVQLESNNHDDLSICAVQAKGKIPVGSLPEIMNTAVQVAKRDAQHTRVYKELSGVNSLLQEPFGIR